jgi:hypothetical protein
MPKDVRPLPDAAKTLSLSEAAELFEPRRARKAVENLVERGVLPVAYDETGGRRRIVTTREWMQEYLRRSPRPGRIKSQPAEPAPTSSRGGRNARSQVSNHWEQIARELALENLELRARVAELENQP